ncbi:unnamed protein product [Nezara viridula]|uniref:Golgi resident protein GCP60 n=1 Tax=Nezara viridula TaxID=85310 RepID=A0A9P0DVB2_NEZVI|nr:unnamed protein product [Nezara viridula]
MATDSDVSISQIDTQFDRLSVASEESSVRCSMDHENNQADEEFISEWGFRLKDLYRLALRFNKEKEGKALSLSYQDKLRFVSLAKQVSVGKFNPDTSSPLGVLDVIGRDRRLAWQSLGDMSTEDAMINFVELLDSRCNLFRPFVQAHKADLENRRKLHEEEEAKIREEEERRRVEETMKMRDVEERQRLEEHKRQIQEALNQQTYGQFKAYVEQHFPDDPVLQEKLLKQLQEEHYNQYMEQLAAERKVEDAALQTPPVVSNGTIVHTQDTYIGDEQPLLSYPDSQHYQSDNDGSIPTVISTASMWTRKDVKEFKESIRKEGGDSIIRVGHGETVTVRVPTNDEGTCLFWEFATDHYDIGFGIYFEWTKSPTNQVSVHVSESEDEEDYNNDDDDDDEDDDELAARYRGDVERGGPGPDPNRPALSVIIPVYRRDCQDRVFAGSHAYPGTGVYLLKFDNSYSLWRSKTLYYRVYYTR